MIKTMEKMDQYEATLDQWILEVPLGMSECQASSGFPDVDAEHDLMQVYDGLFSEDKKVKECYSHCTTVESGHTCEIDIMDGNEISSIIDSSVAMSPISNPTSPEHYPDYPLSSSRELLDVSEPIAIIDDIFRDPHPNAKTIEPSVDIFKSTSDDDILQEILTESTKNIDWNSSRYSQTLKELEELHELTCKKCPSEDAQKVDEKVSGLDTASEEISFSVKTVEEVSLPTSVHVGVLQPVTIIPASALTFIHISSPFIEEQDDSNSADKSDAEWLPGSSSSGTKRKRDESEDDSDDETKVVTKRTQNKEAARRYRDKKKVEAAEVSKQRDELAKVNADLKKDFSKKLEERRIMLDLWKDLVKNKTNPNFSVRFPAWMSLDD